MIKIAIVDDQQLLVEGLKTIISTQDDFTFIGSANNGKDAVALVKRLHPDVVLMDINMPVMNGVEATKEIIEYNKDIKIIILTTFDDDQYVLDALSNGATGYLLKDIEGSKLIDAIKEAYNGSFILPGKIAIKLARNINNNNNKVDEDELELLDELTEREKEVASLLVKGKTVKEISSTLFLSYGTVKNYLSNIYSKLDVPDRTSAVIKLQKLGF